MNHARFARSRQGGSACNYALRKLAAAAPTTFSNMGVVSRPVLVFCREQ
jgi:hypothetical protein